MFSPSLFPNKTKCFLVRSPCKNMLPGMRKYYHGFRSLSRSAFEAWFKACFTDAGAFRRSKHRVAVTFTKGASRSHTGPQHLGRLLKQKLPYPPSGTLRQTSFFLVFCFVFCKLVPKMPHLGSFGPYQQWLTALT